MGLLERCQKNLYLQFIRWFNFIKFEIANIKSYIYELDYGTGSLEYFLYAQFFWNSFNFIIYMGFNALHKLVGAKSNKEKLK